MASSYASAIRSAEQDHPGRPVFVIGGLGPFMAAIDSGGVDRIEATQVMEDYRCDLIWAAAPLAGSGWSGMVTDNLELWRDDTEPVWSLTLDQARNQTVPVLYRSLVPRRAALEPPWVALSDGA